MTSTFRRAIAVAMSATAMTIFSGGLPLSAQELGKAKADTKPNSARRTMDPTRRVPNYFDQLGLSEVQKESIYKIQAKHQPKIEDLEKQLVEQRAQALEECEAVLTDTQKKMLTERRTKAAE